MAHVGAFHPQHEVIKVTISDRISPNPTSTSFHLVTAAPMAVVIPVISRSATAARARAPVRARVVAVVVTAVVGVVDVVVHFAAAAAPAVVPSATTARWGAGVEAVVVATANFGVAVFEIGISDIWVGNCSDRSQCENSVDEKCVEEHFERIMRFGF